MTWARDVYKRQVYSITINLVPNHLDKRAHKYLGICLLYTSPPDAGVRQKK